MPEPIEIHELAPQGDGVHRSERGPVYVEGALPGDRVEVQTKKAAGGVLRGEIVRLTQASPHRQVAPCPAYDVCGGCSLQHASDEFYRDWKAHIVCVALERQNLAPGIWHPPVFLPAGQRRRVTFAAFKKKGRVQLGFFKRRTHQVADIAACLIADPDIMGLRARLVTALAPILTDGETADIFIQTVDGQREIVITGAIGKKGLPDLQVHEAVAALAHDAHINRIAWRRRERDQPEVLLEVNPLIAKFGALGVALPPLAFLQPTKAGEEALVAAVMDALPRRGKFADLFSGCGTFSGPMLARGSVDAYDNVASAVRALDKAKASLPLKAAERDLFRNPLEAAEADRYDAIVFDPPRAGAHEQAKMLAAAQTPVVVGVSCNPGTFARDARILVDGGYKLTSVQVVDQFTWSHHVELVASFQRAT